MAGLESGAHDTDVTRAVEGVVATAVSHLDQLLLDSLAVELSGVDEVGGTELAGPFLLGVVDIDGNDLASLVLNSTLHNGKTDTSSTENSNIGALLNLGGDNGGTVTGCDTAAEQAGSVGRDLGGNSDNGNVGDNSVLGEGGGTHEVEDVLAAGLETRGAVGHHTLALSGTDLAAEVSLARLAELAFPALGGAAEKLDNCSLRLVSGKIQKHTKEQRHSRQASRR